MTRTLLEGLVPKFLLACAVVLAFTGAIQDARSRRIPNSLNYFGLVAALLVRLFMIGWPGLKDGLVGALLGGGLFFILFIAGGMGAGDVPEPACIRARPH